MRDRIARIMAGRNGNDHLNIFLLIVGVIFIILGIVFRNGAAYAFNIIALIDIVIVYLRMFSRNLEKRHKENSEYLSLKYQIVSRIRLQSEKWTQRKEYKFFHCPSCRTVLRVPRGRGRIMIVCKKCGTRFEGKS